MNEPDKFALLTYNTFNVGDDIQSLAALQFLPGVDVRVDRDKIAIKPEDAPDQAKIILNGWYTQAPEQWPPEPFLSPLLTSMHVTEEIFNMNRGKLSPAAFMIRGFGFQYFNERAPIGARDLWTRDLFLQSGISAEFTGCLTLTLGARQIFERQDYVCAVDLPRPGLAQLRRSSARQVVVSSHHIDAGASWGDRAWRARRLLSLYAHAHCVVTTRLHCALPCLALGTPVLLLRTAKDSYRFTGLETLLASCTLDEYLSGSIKFDIDAPPPNPDAYMTLRRGLIARASQFSGFAAADEDSPPFPFEVIPASQSLLQGGDDSIGDNSDDRSISVNEVRRIFPPGCDYTKFQGPDFLRDIGRLLAATGDLDDAARVTRMALALRPHGSWISELLKYYEKESRRFVDSPVDSPEPVFLGNSTLVQSVVDDHLTYLSVERLKSLMAQIEGVKVRRVRGDFLEFGVALGGSGICIAGQLEGARRYWGFDAFAGMPPPSADDGEDALRRYEVITSGKSRGIGDKTYYGYIDDLYVHVLATFAEYGLRVDGRSINLLQGAFDELLPAHPFLTVAAAHVDCDWYESVKYCLHYIYPRLSRFGAIIVDDYSDWSGCRKAVDEFRVGARDMVLLKTDPHAVLVKA